MKASTLITLSVAVTFILWIAISSLIYLGFQEAKEVGLKNIVSEVWDGKQQ